MTLQSLVYQWADARGNDPIHSGDSVVFSICGVTRVRVVQSSHYPSGYSFFVRVANRLPSSHWCGTKADVEGVLEEIVSKLEAEQLAESLS